ncbi:MAG: DNA polymerase IV [Candidatus Zixiibacteriota bacterium]|nr:MAG: DNA polymerase IV [candidate division Zixibacteria bacterium]
MIFPKLRMQKSKGIDDDSSCLGMSTDQPASNAKERTILHVDMDAFYASVEQKNRPWLEGKPVVVGGDPEKRRGVVTAASYAARRYGIGAGMPILTARRLCPHAIFLVGDYGGMYEYVSSLCMQIFRQFTPWVEPHSIDEAFLDVTGCDRLFGPPHQLARKLKGKIKTELGLTCSVGIAPNKLLAKLASSLNKPDGLTVIPKDQVQKILGPLKVTRICGIGDKAAEVLSGLGIHTLGELASYPEEVLTRRFGKNGKWLHLVASGIDRSPVFSSLQAEKSIGHGRTLPQDISGPQQIFSVLLSLSSMVARRLRARGLVGRTISLRVRYSDFVNLTRSETIRSPTDSEHVISRIAETLAADITAAGRKVRLLEVRVSHLGEEGYSLQGSLSLAEYRNRRKEVYPVMDRIRDRFGESAIKWAGSASFI